MSQNPSRIFSKNNIRFVSVSNQNHYLNSSFSCSNNQTQRLISRPSFSQWYRPPYMIADPNRTVKQTSGSNFLHVPQTNTNITEEYIFESNEVPEYDNEVEISTDYNCLPTTSDIYESNLNINIHRNFIQHQKINVLPTKFENFIENKPKDKDKEHKKQGSSKRKENLNVFKSHHMQAIRRLGTLEGWKQMNAWLKIATKNNNVTKLKSLLSQCYQADISCALLKIVDVDTPKFVKKLSKTTNDKELKEAAHRLVNKWLKIVQNAQVDTKSESTDKNNEKILPPMKNSSLKTNTPKINDTDDSDKEIPQKNQKVEEKIDNPVQNNLKKERPKTAKIFTREFRKTGLENLEDTEILLKEKSTVISPESNIANDNIFSTAFDEISALTSKKVDLDNCDKIKLASHKKRTIAPSDLFLENLLPTPKKAKIVKKKSKSDQIDTTEKITHIISTTSNLADSVVELERKSSFRKIHFADERGLDLIEIRYFEKDKGERINVAKYSPEDMKRFEMKQEAKKEIMKELKNGLAAPWATELPLPKGVNIIPWKLIPLNDAIRLIEPGNKSEIKLNEKTRPFLSMSDYSILTNIDEPEEINSIPDPNHMIKLIPLQMDFKEIEPSNECLSSDKIIPTNLAPPKILASLGINILQLAKEVANLNQPELKNLENNDEISPPPNVTIPSDIRNLLEDIKKTGLVLDKNKEKKKEMISFSELSDILNKVQSKKVVNNDAEPTSQIQTPLSQNLPETSNSNRKNLNYLNNKNHILPQKSNLYISENTGAVKQIDSIHNQHICRFYLKGTCRFGNKCKNVHGNNINQTINIPLKNTSGSTTATSDVDLRELLLNIEENSISQQKID